MKSLCKYVLSAICLISSLTSVAQQTDEYFPVGTLWEECLVKVPLVEIDEDNVSVFRWEVAETIEIGGSVYKKAMRQLIYQNGKTRCPVGEDVVVFKERNDSIIIFVAEGNEYCLYDFNWPNKVFPAENITKKLLNDGKEYDDYKVEGNVMGEVIRGIGHLMGSLLQNLDEARCGYTLSLKSFTRNGVLIYNSGYDIPAIITSPVDYQRDKSKYTLGGLRVEGNNHSSSTVITNRKKYLK